MQGNCSATRREELTRRMYTGGLIGYLPDLLKLADTRKHRCIHAASFNHRGEIFERSATSRSFRTQWPMRMSFQNGAVTLSRMTTGDDG